jgi:hypothetical protein
MEQKDEIGKLHGHWKFEIYKGDNRTKENLIEVREGDNTVVTNGKQLLLDRLFATAGFGGPINSMGVGNSATASASTDTQLGGSAPSPVLQALDSTPTRAGLVATCISTFATGTANQTWQELGLFNGTVNGTSIMLNRIAPIGPFTKTASVSIVVTVTITQS